MPVPALKALRAEFPNVQFGALHSAYGSQVTVPTAGDANGNKFIEETGIFFCEPQFFNVFNYNWLSGNASVLSEPNSVVISKSTAERFFGNWKQAVGKTILLANAISLKINGVLQDVPANSDFPLSILASMETVRNHGSLFYYTDNWNTVSSNFQVFARLDEHTKATDINKALLKFGKTHYTNKDRGFTKYNFLQPLADIHFDGRFESFGDHITSKATLFTLTLIGVFILLMACVNFVNLSTALAVTRSKEVGIRKVLGGNRSVLFWQIMGETAVIVLLAIIVAIGIVYLALPYIKYIASIEEQLSLFNVKTIGALLLLGCVVTLFAGLYPSFVLSKYNPINALKNKMMSASVQGISLRRGLVVMQFAISQILIIATVVAVSQMNFIRKADLGFNKESVILLSGNGDSTSVARQSAFKQQLLQTPGVQSVNFSADAPSSENYWSSNFAYDHKPDEKFQVSLKFADAEYIKTFGLQLVAGRNYAESDTVREIVVNETLVKKLGAKNPGEVIGKTLRLGGGQWYPIVGVVKDFKTSSLREEIKPLILSTNKKYYSLAAIKLRTTNLSNTTAAIQKVWDQHYPEYAWSSAFFDENINEFYEQEDQLSLLYKIFAGLAIFISCLGLYGLVSFMTVQKTKEVGIRKVLGASVGSLVQLFSKEFTILIIVSFFIAVPVSWMMMHNWLSNFVYRIPLSPGIFAIAIISSILIAWISVGYKAIRAALANPVKSLRTE
jgi:putative ABC transport system permease protein